MSYFNRLQGALNKEDLQRFVRKRPSQKKYQGHPDGRVNKKYTKTADAGQIDFHHYGGKKSKETKWEELISGAKYWDKKKGKGKNDQTRKDWKKVAKDLGIDKVDSEKEVLRMIEHVRGYKYQKEDDSGTDSDNNQPAIDPNPSNTERPDSVKQDQQRYLDTKLDRPENQMPRLEDAFRGTTDATMGAIRGGDDLNKHYQTKFIPHLEAEARATSSEIGDDSRFFLSKFTFEPPKLGSIKDIFDKYKSEIEDLD